MKKKQIVRFKDSKYFGEVKNGKPHGKGTMTYPNGRIEKGYWKNEKFVK